MKFQSLFVFFIVIFSINACKKNEIDPTITGLSYFPMEENFYRIYAVDSISISAALEINDTSFYQIKEVQDSLFFDSGGTLSMRIKRYKRLADSLAWEISDIWTAHRNNSSAQVVEENVRKLLMTFPPREDVNWDLNTFNSGDEWNCSYSIFHQSMQLAGMSFDSTVTVKYDDNINLIERETGNLIFATQVGLIEKKEQILELNEVVPVDEMPTLEQIENGVILTYTIKEFGYE